MVQAHDVNQPANPAEIVQQHRRFVPNQRSNPQQITKLIKPTITNVGQGVSVSSHSLACRSGCPRSPGNRDCSISRILAKLQPRRGPCHKSIPTSAIPNPHTGVNTSQPRAEDEGGVAVAGVVICRKLVAAIRGRVTAVSRSSAVRVVRNGSISSNAETGRGGKVKGVIGGNASEMSSAGLNVIIGLRAESRTRWVRILVIDARQPIAPGKNATSKLPPFLLTSDP